MELFIFHARHTRSPFWGVRSWIVKHKICSLFFFVFFVFAALAVETTSLGLLPLFLPLLEQHPQLRNSWIKILDQKSAIMMTGFRLNLSPLKEPIGFVKLVEWVSCTQIIVRVFSEFAGRVWVLPTGQDREVQFFLDSWVSPSPYRRKKNTS